jgi:phospholipid/cholesterol/gamma-HCH transport system substrate-binding protein
MPLHEKARWAKLKIGILTIFALSILGVLIFLLTGNTSPFSSKSTVYTYMSDSAALTENAPVRLNGIIAGKVSDIALSGSNNPDRAVRIAMQIDDKYMPKIPDNSIAAIGAENLLGTKYINITIGTSSTPVKPGGELPAKNTAEWNDVVEQGNTLLVQLQTILTRVNAIVGDVESGKGSIGKLLVDEELYNRMLATVTEVQQLATALNSDKGTIGKLIYDDQFYNDVRGTIGRLDTLLDGLQAGQGSAGKFLKDPSMYNDAHDAILQIRSLLAGINAGQGTAGKLIKSDQLANQISATIARIDLMLDKVNAGQGTIGQLMVNPTLYDNLSGATRQLHLLMKDFRANPKKFLRIKLSIF